MRYIRKVLFVTSALVIGSLLASCGGLETKAVTGSIEAQYDQDCLQQASTVCTCYPDEERPTCITFRGRSIDYEAFCPIDPELPSERKDCD